MNAYADMPGNAGRCINSWHIRTGNLVTTESAAVNNAAAAINAFYTALKALFPSTSGQAWKADFAVNVEDATDVSIDVAKWPVVLCTGGALLAPPHLAACVSWKTSIRARRGRGRTFLGPFVTSTLEDDGTIRPATVTAINSAATALVNASLTDNDWAIGVWGLQDPAPKDYQGDYNDLPHVIRDVVGYQLQDKWAVMRSRRS
jgi:hypothetical protein